MNLNSDDDVINLRKVSSNLDEPEFKIERLPEEAGELEVAAMKSYDKVKVKFDKFVNLVATHAYEEVFEKHANEDVIISTDLLADLANSHEDTGEKKKIPVVFLIGILLGIGVTWILLRS